MAENIIKVGPIKGPKGATGATGLQGAKGDIGPVGEKGNEGPLPTLTFSKNATHILVSVNGASPIPFVDLESVRGEPGQDGADA
jgi:hypothetical protein